MRISFKTSLELIEEKTGKTIIKVCETKTNSEDSEIQYNKEQKKQILKAKLDKTLQNWENAEKELEKINTELHNAAIEKTDAAINVNEKIKKLQLAETTLATVNKTDLKKLKAAVRQLKSAKTALEKAKRIQEKKQITYSKAVTHQAEAQDNYDNSKNDYIELEKQYNNLVSLI